MSQTFFIKIISGTINSVNNIDLVGDNVTTIRKDLIEFFSHLSKWTFILQNVGETLNNSLSKKDLVLYEELMEADGLKGIFNLFTEKVQSSFTQIIQRMKTNDKLANALNYFTKDYLFVYFCILNYQKKNRISINTQELKDLYFEKFKAAANDNISRALNLIVSLRRLYLNESPQSMIIYLYTNIQRTS